MKNVHSLRAVLATAMTAAASVAQAAGDSGTSSVGEMQVSGYHLLAIVGGLIAMGGVIWLVSKFAGK